MWFFWGVLILSGAFLLCLKDDMPAAELGAEDGRAFLAISFDSTSDMISFTGLSNIPGKPSISRLMSVSAMPERSTSLAMVSVKSTILAHVHVVEYPHVSAFPRTLVANVLNRSSRSCFKLIRSALMTHVATAMTARFFMASSSSTVDLVTMAGSDFSKLSPSVSPAH